MNKKLSIGQAKDQIAKQITKFYAETLGHGPKDTKVYILDDMVIARLKGRLLPVEKKLLEGEEGVNFVKNIRKKLHEVLTKNLALIVEDITGHKVISTHSDISTKTGEMFEVFIIDTNYETEFNLDSKR